MRLLESMRPRLPGGVALRILAHTNRRRQLASVLQPLATQRVYVLTPARDAYLELELLDEARLEDGLQPVGR